MIKPLTSLRFVFAFMVFALHISNSHLFKKLSEPLQWLALNVFKEGYIGVGFFFMLSGFILTHSYKNRLLHAKISKKRFWIVRFARIYPLHLLTLFLSIPLVKILWGYNMEGIELPFLINFYLLQSYILPAAPNWFWWFNSVSWSISVEAFLYVVFPFFIFFLNRSKILFTYLTILFCIAVPILMFFNNGYFREEWFYIHPVLRTVDFLIGILLYEVYLKIEKNKLIYFTSYTEFFAVFVFILFFSFHQYIGSVYRLSCYYWIPVSFIILVFSLKMGAISQFLSNRYFVYLGEISFGFYMFHALIIEYGLRINDHYRIFEKNYFIFIVCLFLLSVFVASLSYHFFEQPITRFITKKQKNN